MATNDDWEITEPEASVLMEDMSEDWSRWREENAEERRALEEAAARARKEEGRARAEARRHAKATTDEGVMERRRETGAARTAAEDRQLGGGGETAAERWRRVVEDEKEARRSGGGAWGSRGDDSEREEGARRGWGTGEEPPERDMHAEVARGEREAAAAAEGRGVYDRDRQRQIGETAAEFEKAAQENIDNATGGEHLRELRDTGIAQRLVQEQRESFGTTFVGGLGRQTNFLADAVIPDEELFPHSPNMLASPDSARQMEAAARARRSEARPFDARREIFERRLGADRPTPDKTIKQIREERARHEAGGKPTAAFNSKRLALQQASYGRLEKGRPGKRVGSAGQLQAGQAPDRLDFKESVAAFDKLNKLYSGDKTGAPLTRRELAGVSTALEGHPDEAEFHHRMETDIEEFDRKFDAQTFANAEEAVEFAKDNSNALTDTYAHDKVRAYVRSPAFVAQQKKNVGAAVATETAKTAAKLTVFNMVATRRAANDKLPPEERKTEQELRDITPEDILDYQTKPGSVFYVARGGTLTKVTLNNDGTKTEIQVERAKVKQIIEDRAKVRRDRLTVQRNANAFRESDRAKDMTDAQVQRAIDTAHTDKSNAFWKWYLNPENEVEVVSDKGVHSTRDVKEADRKRRKEREGEQKLVEFTFGEEVNVDMYPEMSDWGKGKVNEFLTEEVKRFLDVSMNEELDLDKAAKGLTFAEGDAPVGVQDGGTEARIQKAVDEYRKGSSLDEAVKKAMPPFFAGELTRGAFDTLYEELWVATHDEMARQLRGQFKEAREHFRGKVRDVTDTLGNIDAATEDAYKPAGSAENKVRDLLNASQSWREAGSTLREVGELTAEEVKAGGQRSEKSRPGALLGQQDINALAIAWLENDLVGAGADSFQQGVIQKQLEALRDGLHAEGLDENLKKGFLLRQGIIQRGVNEYRTKVAARAVVLAKQAEDQQKLDDANDQKVTVEKQRRENVRNDVEKGQAVGFDKINDGTESAYRIFDGPNAVADAAEWERATTDQREQMVVNIKQEKALKVQSDSEIMSIRAGRISLTFGVGKQKTGVSAVPFVIRNPNEKQWDEYSEKIDRDFASSPQLRLEMQAEVVKAKAAQDERTLAAMGIKPDDPLFGVGLDALAEIHAATGGEISNDARRGPRARHKLKHKLIKEVGKGVADKRDLDTTRKDVRGLGLHGGTREFSEDVVDLSHISSEEEMNEFMDAQGFTRKVRIRLPGGELGWYRPEGAAK